MEIKGAPAVQIFSQFTKETSLRALEHILKLKTVVLVSLLRKL